MRLYDGARQFVECSIRPGLCRGREAGSVVPKTLARFRNSDLFIFQPPPIHQAVSEQKKGPPSQRQTTIGEPFCSYL